MPPSDKRRPWVKWYTRDWRADPPLRMCSFAARGLWVDLLSLMGESRVFGFLLVEGVSPTDRQLAGLLGGSEREIGRLKAELHAANVFSVTGAPMPDDVAGLVPPNLCDGVILSRRMVRDRAKEERDRENGKGGGNPKLRKVVIEGVNPQANAQNTEVRKKELGEAPSGLPPDETSPPIAAHGRLEGAAHDSRTIPLPIKRMSI